MLSESTAALIVIGTKLPRISINLAGGTCTVVLTGQEQRSYKGVTKEFVF